MPFIAGNKTTLKVNGTATALTDEPTTEVSGTVFQITDASKRVLVPDSTFEVEVDAVAADSSTYTIDYLFGKITFDSTQTGSTVTISSSGSGDHGYYPMAAWANGYSVTLTLARIELEKTVFGDDAVGRTPGTQDCNGSVEVYDHGLTDFTGTTTNVEDILSGGQAILLEIDLDGTGTYLLRAWVRIQADEVSVDVDALVEETVNLVSAKRLASMDTQDVSLWSHNFA